jgi:hypothetical protein
LELIAFAFVVAASAEAAAPGSTAFGELGSILSRNSGRLNKAIETGLKEVPTSTVVRPQLLENGDAVIGLIKEGKIINQFKHGGDFSVARSHPSLAEETGALLENGKLAPGIEAFTVWKEGGRIYVRGSNNFVPTVTSETEALLKTLFQ